MPSENISTSVLLQKLFKTQQIKKFIKRYDTQMRSITFHQYIMQICDKKDLLPAQIIKKSGIERTFGHQIFNGIRNPSRDKVLQLAFGFEMNYGEVINCWKQPVNARFIPESNAMP